MKPSEEYHYRIKVFIPAFYEVFGKQALFETIGDAIRGLNISNFKFEDDPRADGAYLYLFSSRIFPYVANGDETPDGQLLLSASEGWKVKWSKLIKSPIVTRH